MSIPVKRVVVPPEFHSVSPDDVESFLGQQLAAFANGLAHRLDQLGYPIPADVFTTASREVFQLMTSKPPAAPVAHRRELQLVFRHDCLSLGCLLPNCKLCQHNPNRRCEVNLDRKYLVSDVLKAKCQATIRVEVVDHLTGEPVDEDLGDNILLQMAILDGNAYDAKHEAGRENEFDLKSCVLLTNNKNAPLLVGSGVSNDAEGHVVVPLRGCRTMLPELRVTDSSEARLSGRKPPLRLMLRAVYADTTQQVPHIRHAISEGFVVATRRTRTAGKADIPSVDDHVSKLEHMGKETVKKLSDVIDAGRVAGLEDFRLPGFPPGTVCIDKVGQFRKLALMAEQDHHLRQRLQQILKLSKEKWEDARDHALKAVVVDNRMRVWWSPQHNFPRMGVFFTCFKGTVDLEHPVGLTQDGQSITYLSILQPQERELLRRLQPMAVSQWWQSMHPGWEVTEWDSEVFRKDRTLVRCVLDESSTLTIPPSANTRGSSGAGVGTSRPRERSSDEGLFYRRNPAEPEDEQLNPRERHSANLGREPLASPPATRIDPRYNNRGHSAPINSQHLFRMHTAFDDRSDVPIGRDAALSRALETLTDARGTIADLNGGDPPGHGLLNHHARRGPHGDSNSLDPRVALLEARQLSPAHLGAMHPDATLLSPERPTSDVQLNLSGLKSEELGIDFLPSMQLGNSMTMQPSFDMLNRHGLATGLSLVDPNGVGMTFDRMQTDDWMGAGGPLHLQRDSMNTMAQLSRNASGLDTMQSIEQALPEELHSQALRAQNAALQQH